MNIRVSEHFYSLQGEGATMGVPAVFIRLQACNLLCGGYGTQKDGKLHDGATWRCDTLDVWTKGKKNTVELFAEKVNELYGDVLREGAHLVWTGGEPMMQQDAICRVMEILQEYGINPFVEVETNGTIEPTEDMDCWVNLFNVSPKLANSGMPKEKRYIPSVIEYFNNCPHSIFKFVISNLDDFDEVMEYKVDLDKLYLMPSAEDIDELKNNYETVTELCKKHTIKFCTRLQIELWNKTTGV